MPDCYNKGGAHKPEDYPDYFLTQRKSEPIQEDWADGRLTFDDIKNILDICNVNNVKIKQDSLLINFVPKNVIGKVWRELRGKMHQTIER